MIDDFKILCKVIGAASVLIFASVLIVGGLVFALQAVVGPSAEQRAAAQIPQLMSETEGCRVYRFVDSGTHYFTRCGAQVETTRHYTENCGKGCTRARTESITTEGNK